MAIEVCAGLGPADAEHLSKHEWKQARKSQNSKPSYYNKLKFIKLKQVSRLLEALAFSSAGTGQASPDAPASASASSDASAAAGKNASTSSLTFSATHSVAAPPRLVASGWDSVARSKLGSRRKKWPHTCAKIEVRSDRPSVSAN